MTVLGVTKGLEAYANEGVLLSGASRAGLYRMLQSEYSHLTSRHADMECEASHEELARLIAVEYYAKSTESEVCYRNGQRYRAYLTEQPAEAALSHKQVSFSTDKVLLITGGTRGLGLLCARHFVKHTALSGWSLSAVKSFRRVTSGIR